IVTKPRLTQNGILENGRIFASIAELACCPTEIESFRFFSRNPGKTFLVNPKYSGNLENYWETKGKKDDCSGELPSPSFNNCCCSP
ncbi:MAG: hypothetical protein ACKPA9_35215, partial [Microcystis sp.]